MSKRFNVLLSAIEDSRTESELRKLSKRARQALIDGDIYQHEYDRLKLFIDSKYDELGREPEKMPASGDSFDAEREFKKELGKHPSKASSSELKNARNRLTKKHHPDLDGSTKKQRKINEKYNFYKNNNVTSSENVKSRPSSDVDSSDSGRSGERYDERMGKKELARYISKLKSNGNSERAKRLKKQYKRWRRKGYKKDRAATKALASVQQSDLYSQGRKSAAGRATTQHQEHSRYRRVGREFDDDDANGDEFKPPAEVDQGRSSEFNPPVERGKKTPVERGKKPPKERDFKPPVERGKKTPVERGKKPPAEVDQGGSSEFNPPAETSATQPDEVITNNSGGQSTSSSDSSSSTIIDLPGLFNSNNSGSNNDGQEVPGECPVCGSNKIEVHPNRENPYVCENGHVIAPGDLLPASGGSKQFLVFRSPASVMTFGIISILSLIFSLWIMPGLSGILFSLGIIFLALEQSLMSEGEVAALKPMMRLFGFGLISWGMFIFVGGRPVFRLLPIILGSVGILSCPAELNDESAYDRNLSIVRMGLGISNTLLFFFIFRPTFAGTMTIPFLPISFLGLSFLLISGAFFIIPPTNLQTDYGDSKTGDILSKSLTMFGILIIIFVIIIGVDFAGMGITESIYGIIGAISGVGLILLGSFGRNTDSIIFGAASGFGIITGTASLMGSPMALFFFILMMGSGAVMTFETPNSRPILGIPLLFLMIIAVTSAYPSVMGEAVFGDWWPNIYAGIQGMQESVDGLGLGLEDMRVSLGEGWQCLTSPMECYQRYDTDTEAEKGYRAMVINEMRPLGLEYIDSPPSPEDPYELNVLLTLENQLTDERIDAPPEIDNVDIEPKLLTYLTGDQEATLGQATINGRCGDAEVCEDQYFYPGLVQEYDIEYVLTGDTDIEGAGAALDPNRRLVYGVDVEYPVNTSVTVDAEIMDEERFNHQARTEELQFYTPTSVYEWGPISIGIAPSRQLPMREDTSDILIFEVENKGDGEFVEFLDEIRFESDDDEILYIPESCGENLTDHVIDNIEDDGTLPSEGVTGTCRIETGDIDEPGRTVGIRGYVSYRYRMRDTNDIDIQFACMTDDDCPDGECVDGECVTTPDEIDVDVSQGNIEYCVKHAMKYWNDREDIIEMSAIGWAESRCENDMGYDSPQELEAHNGAVEAAEEYCCYVHADPDSPGNADEPYGVNPCHGSIGLWQIFMPYHYPKVEARTEHSDLSDDPCITAQELRDPDLNARVAREIEQNSGKGAWHTYGIDRYEDALSDAEDAYDAIMDELEEEEETDEDETDEDEYVLTVDSTEGGSTSPSEGTHTYTEGFEVGVSYDADEGYEFNTFTGACEDFPCVVTMDDDKSVTAHFVADELEEFDSCDPDDDQCGPGLVCEEYGEDYVCLDPDEDYVEPN